MDTIIYREGRTVCYLPCHAQSPEGHLINMSVKLFTLDEVKSHNNGKSCWLSIHDKVYDVSKFIDEVRSAINFRDLYPYVSEASQCILQNYHVISTM